MKTSLIHLPRSEFQKKAIMGKRDKKYVLFRRKSILNEWSTCSQVDGSIVYE